MCPNLTKTFILAFLWILLKWGFLNFSWLCLCLGTRSEDLDLVTRLVSVSTSGGQSDSMYKKTHACCWQRRWGGGVTVREGKGRHGGGKEVRGMRGSQSWKQMWFQVLPKGSIVFCLAKLVWQSFSKGGCSIAEWPCSWRFLVFVLAKSNCSVCTRKRSRENRVDCMGKLVPGDTVVRF